MQRFLKGNRRAGVWILAIPWIFLAGAPLLADNERHASATVRDEAWRQSIDLIGHGRFDEAAKRIEALPDGITQTDKVRTWLKEYEEQQARRREADKADFEKYVRYAKERMERKEYALALDKAYFAWDVAEDRDAFLQSDWLGQLVKDALAEAQKLRDKQDWRGAWRIYSDLAVLFEHEPMYGKLEREVQTHLRLDLMFEDENHWEERLDKVRWEDAETALELINFYYVVPPDFKAVCESGLEQLLILADSKSAREKFEGLANEHDRADFKARIEAKLDQVRHSPTLDRRDCTQHFRRVVKKINPQTIRLPEELLVSELMRGALNPLDDYTTVIWPRDAEDFEKHTRGDFYGVGISIVADRISDEIEVASPLEDSPAFRAGIQAGDIITAVNGDPIKGKSLDAVVDIITGPEGTPVTLTVRRGESDMDFTLNRALIKIRSVKGIRRDPTNEEKWDHWLDRGEGIGYVRLTNFQSNTYEDLQNALAELEAQGLRGLVLDLRGNPGGLLDSAWRISSMFLKADDIVVKTKGRDRSENHDFPTPFDGAYSDLPMVVLTDENSASASEIVAGAIRDNDRGEVIGTRTFGKFSVQNLITLSQRSNAKLKITTSRYYLPSGVSLHRDPDADTWGVEPDVPVRLVRKELVNLFKMRREADLIGPPKAEADKDDMDALNDLDGPDDKPAEREKPAGVADAKDAGGDTSPQGDVKVEGEAKADGAEVAEVKEDKLPPLEQPDENNRPKEDPQLDTALLVMRVKLLSSQYPSLAKAATTLEPARP